MVFSSKEISILVVEDNPGDFFLVQDFLKDEFHHIVIHEARSFREAEFHLQGQMHLDCVLLDLTLPDSSGETLVEDILRLSGNIPVIVLTGFGDKNFGIKTLTLGIADYLFKDELNSAQLYKSVAYSIERRRIVNELQASNERFEAVSKATSDTIWDWDVINDRIQYNNGLFQMLGYEASEVNRIQSWWQQNIHPDDIESVMDAIDDAFDNTIPQVQFEYRFKCADGSFKYILDKAVLIFDNKGRAIRMIGAMQDISQRKMHEIQLEELLNVTKYQNTRLQNFAYIVSHNIRSHSSNIIGIVNFMEECTSETDKQMFFEMLKTSTDKLSQTIENLNEIITIQNDTEAQKKSLNLRDELQKTFNAVNVMISQSGTRVMNDVGKEVMVDVVPSYLESILLNLITNAVKYRSTVREPEIQLFTRQIPGFLVLSVKDNGLGLDLKKYGEKVFGMYVTFHKLKDARGFGLYITKNQVEAMEGRIEVESEPDVGSEFRVYFKTGN
jgi:PAS domain S-box-containing protein